MLCRSIRPAGGGEAEFQSVKRLAAPILVDAVGEGRAVTGRAGEIDGDDAIALLRKEARVPARRPAVAETALRPAVDEEGDGQFLDRADRKSTRLNSSH